MSSKQLILLCILGLLGCTTPDRVEVVLDEPDPERLLRFYFGSYTEGTVDPFQAGVLSERDGRYFVDAERLEALSPGTGSQLLARTTNSVLPLDSLGAFLADTYYDARALPRNIDDLHAQWPYKEWSAYEVQGPMTRALRRIFVDDGAVRRALESFRVTGEKLRYPDGSAIVAEHWVDSTLVEYTVMVRRVDGYWDFATYDSAGLLTDNTQALPRALQTPHQCTGCHFGSKLFEPERSFPMPALPGPDGPRIYHVGQDARDAEVTAYFDEHAKRDDTILGLYATMYVSRLRANRHLLSESDIALLVDLGL